MQTHLDTPARPRPEAYFQRVIRIGARWGLACGCSLGVTFGSSSCEEYGPRVYTAAPYRVARGCLDPYVPLGLVQGRDLGAQCERACLREGGTLYVSTVCPPYPAEATLEAADAGNECVAALAAASCDRDAAAP